MTRAISPQNLTVARNGGLTAVVSAFAMALTENEFGPKKIDRIGDLTGRRESTVCWNFWHTKN